VDPACTKGTQQFKEAKCPIKFEYEGTSHSTCIKDKLTPTELDENCQHFRKKMAVTDKWMHRPGFNMRKVEVY
jgi:hypothetical protein